jgi:hypothetical protein
MTEANFTSVFVGFDSDDPGIFARQREFVWSRAASRTRCWG